jgi:hypothetical protein
MIERHGFNYVGLPKELSDLIVKIEDLSARIDDLTAIVLQRRGLWSFIKRLFE